MANMDLGEHEKLRLMPPDKLVQGRFQPREEYDEEFMAQLAASMRDNGFKGHKPVIAWPPNEKGECELTVGHTRTAAAGMANLSQIPVIIKDYAAIYGDNANKEAFKEAFGDNHMRRNPSAANDLRSIRRMVKEFGCTADEIAVTLGKSPDVVKEDILVSMLPDEIIDLLESKDLSKGIAVMIAKEPAFRNAAKQKKAANAALRAKKGGPDAMRKAIDRYRIEASGIQAQKLGLIQDHYAESKNAAEAQKRVKALQKCKDSLVSAMHEFVKLSADTDAFVRANQKHMKDVVELAALMLQRGKEIHASAMVIKQTRS